MKISRSINSTSTKIQRIILLATTALALPLGAYAADSDATSAPEDVIVYGSLLPKNLSSLPGSYQVLEPAQIEKYMGLSSNIGQLLEQAVPGMSPDQGDGSNFTNDIRGRQPAYLIDGFPQTMPLRGGGRDMRIIDPSAIQRIEIIRGATALYGQGGAGGYINYITKQPVPGEWRLSSEVGLGSGLSHIGSDGINYEGRQSIMGGTKKWDMLISAFYQKTGVAYDGEGNAIPPDPFQQGGLSEANTKNGLFKLGLNMTEDQRLEASFNYYKNAQHTDYVQGTTGSVPGIPAPRVPKNSPTASIYGNGPTDPFTKNVFGTLSYTNKNILGSALRLSGMYQDYDGSYTFSPYYYPNGDSAAIVGKKYTVRADVNTPLEFAKGYLIWGAEWTKNGTGQTGVASGAVVMPYITLNDYAGFAQFHASPLEWLSVNGGIRYEYAKLDIPTYQTVRQYKDPSNPGLGFKSANLPVAGGHLTYKKPLFNFGVVAYVAPEASIYADYSQGFTVSDVGRVLRNFSGGSVFDHLNDISPEITDNYEIGVRTTSDHFKGSVALYYNKSSLGSSYDPITLNITRAPERVWGAELTADVILEKVRFGGTLAWANSEVDSNNDGTFESKLNYWRVPPVEATGYVEYDFRPEWTLRFQGLKVFSDNRFPDVVPYTASAESPINSYFVLDMLVSGKVGPGTLSLGIKNVLNNKYFSLLAQTSVASRPDTYTMAQGATALLKYSVNY